MGAETGSGSPVLVVDDDEECRALLVSLLERIGCTAFEATNGVEALEIADTVHPELVLLDVGIPGITGYEVCHELREKFGRTLAVVFVSGARIEPIDRVAGLLIGADDYIVKPFDPDELLARVRRLLKRNGGGSPNARVNGDSSIILDLTAREREVLTLLAKGRDQEQIATELFISPKTVATHIQRMLAKLGVHSRAQAVALAHRERLVDDVEAHLSFLPAPSL